MPPGQRTPHGDWCHANAVVIASAADDGYAMPLAVMVRSLLANLAPKYPVHLFVLDGGIRPWNRRRLRKSWRSDRLRVEWIRPDTRPLRDLKVSGHIGITSYFRLLLPDVLPKWVERVIYLDSDLVVEGNLAELWDLDLQGCPVAAVQDMIVPYVSASNGLRTWRELGLPADRKYFNAGVLLIDLLQWRKDDMSRKILQYLTLNRSYIRWHDQDGFNAIVGDRCLELERRWNLTIQSRSFPCPKDIPCSPEEYEALLERPSICHFATVVKPWHIDCEHPLQHLFFRHLGRTDWASWRPRLRSTDRLSLPRRIAKRVGGLYAALSLR